MKRTNSGVRLALHSTVKKHPLITVATIICIISSVTVSLVPPLLLARVIDKIAEGTLPTFASVLVYFLSLALEGVFSSAQQTLLVVFGQKTTHELRTEMSKKLTRLNTNELIDRPAGETSARFLNDVDTVENLFSFGIVSMVADFLRIISILAVIAVKNLGLALILLIVLPILAIFTRHVQKNSLKAQLENRKAVASVSGIVPETLHNIRTIKLIGLENYMEKRYDEKIADGYRAVEKNNFYDAVYSPVVLLLNATVIAIVMLLSASSNPKILTIFGMSVGTSVAIIDYVSRIFAPIESLGMEIQTVQSAMAGVKRINDFLSKPERKIITETDKLPCGDIVFSAVNFGYGKNDVLVDFSMTVKRGEQLTLIGKTGVGKSTVFKLLLGLYLPKSGTITIGGFPVSEISDENRREVFGCVEQKFSPTLGTVYEQITLGDKRITKEMAKYACELVGIDKTVQSLPNGYDTVYDNETFSQGETQLLSIARAVALNPQILLLDEITANLDAQTEAIVLSALRSASKGRTVVSVSHRLYENLGGKTLEIKSRK